MKEFIFLKAVTKLSFILHESENPEATLHRCSYKKVF